MAKTVTITAISASGNRRYVRFSSGREYEFNSLTEFQELIDDIPDDILERIALLFIRRRRPNLTNLAGLIGKGLKVDFDVDTWGTLV